MEALAVSSSSKSRGFPRIASSPFCLSRSPSFYRAIIPVLGSVYVVSVTLPTTTRCRVVDQGISQQYGRSVRASQARICPRQHATLELLRFLAGSFEAGPSLHGQQLLVFEMAHLQTGSPVGRHRDILDAPLLSNMLAVQQYTAPIRSSTSNDTTTGEPGLFS